MNERFNSHLVHQQSLHVRRKISRQLEAIEKCQFYLSKYQSLTYMYDVSMVKLLDIKNFKLLKFSKYQPLANNVKLVKY